MKTRYKRLAAALLLTASLTACGGQGVSSGPTISDGETSVPASSDTASVSSGEKKILIAYFTADENREVDAVTSASITTVDGVNKGRVRAVADMIQSETGGDLFSIQTSVGYPSDGGKLVDFAAEEQNRGDRPELTSQIENLEDYGVIFVGYQTWWYDMPMVLYSFFDAYDFSGKTIIPFNVHNGSRFSGTIQTIQELEPEANVITDGFTVSERSVADAAGNVAEWVKGLEL